MSAPLTLAQCRAVIDTIDTFGCSRCEDGTNCETCEFTEYKGLLATIEWLIPALEVCTNTMEGPDPSCRKCESLDVCKWLRGEA